MTRRNRAKSLAALLLALAPALAVAQATEDVRTADFKRSVPAGKGTSTALWRLSPLAVYDNGPLVTHVGGGPGGADASRVQNNTLGMSTLGSSASISTGTRMADDFTVSAPGWVVNTITFFGYQTGSTTTSTFNDVRVQIWDGPPNAGGTLVWGDTTTSRFASTAFTNVYRDAETAVGDSQRPIMAVTATIGTTLAPGTYWVDYQLGGTLASGPWVPPTTVLGQTSGCTLPAVCNALRFSSGAWSVFADGATTVQQDAPFVVDYALTPVELQGFTAD